MYKYTQLTKLVLSLARSQGVTHLDVVIIKEDL